MKTKITKLLCIAALALGAAQQANADPISASGSVSVSDFGLGLAEFSFDMTVGAGFTLIGMDVFLDGTLDILPTWVFTPDTVPSSWTDFPFPGANPFCSLDPDSCILQFDNFFGVTGMAGFNLTLTADVGSSIANLGLLPSPIFNFYFLDFMNDVYDFTILPTDYTVNEYDPTGVPEPGTLALLGLGLLGLGASRRRHRTA